MASCRLIMLLAAFLIAVTQATATAEVIYANDFEGFVGSEWSLNATDVTPSGRNFLGLFRNDAPRLTLSALPAHGTVTVSFDLYIIGTWDGNAALPEAGPDVWALEVDGGPTLLRTTFGQWPGFTQQYGQAYPDAYPGGTHPFRSGASEVGTLGYTDPFWDGGGDSVYSLSFTFSHSSPSLALIFTGTLLDSFPPNERWGIDNVAVSVSAVPEPSSAVLALACALFGVSATRAGRWYRRHRAAWPEKGKVWK